MLKSILNYLFTAGSGTSTPGVIAAISPGNEIICLENDIGKIIFPTIIFSREIPSSQIVLPDDKHRLPPCGLGRLQRVVATNKETHSPFSLK